MNDVYKKTQEAGSEIQGRKCDVLDVHANYTELLDHGPLHTIPRLGPEGQIGNVCMIEFPFLDTMWIKYVMSHDINDTNTQAWRHAFSNEEYQTLTGTILLPM